MEDPIIKTKNVKLVGIQAVVIHEPDYDSAEELDDLWKKVINQLDNIPNIADVNLSVGYWHWINKFRRLYFAGIMVKTLEGFKRNNETGLCSWDLGESEMAIFSERNGEEGKIVSNPEVFKKINKLGYRVNNQYTGEFVVYPIAELEKETMCTDEYHEVWIPIEKK